MQVLTNAHLVLTDEKSSDYRVDAAFSVAIDNGRIAWIGRDSELPDTYLNAPRRDLAGRLVTPGLIDCLHPYCL